jgi:PAS domain S-box-containing protein
MVQRHFPEPPTREALAGRLLASESLIGEALVGCEGIEGPPAPSIGATADTAISEAADWPSDIRSLARVVMSAPMPMAILAGREGIVLCNEAAREMFGDAHAAAQGRPIGEVLPIAADFYRKAIAACHDGRSLRLSDQPIKLCRDGEWQTCWFNLSLSPVTDGQGVVLGTLLVAHESSAYIRARRALNISYQRMEMALEAGGIVGTWDFDVANRTIILDGSLAQQYGVSEADARSGVPAEALFENLHPEDQDATIAAFEAAAASGIDFRARFRTITKNGELRWYVAAGRPLRDDQQRITQLAGIIIDTTHEVETATALAHSKLRFDTLVEAIAHIVWSTDAEGTHDYFNRRWSEFTGIDHADITPEMWTHLVHPDDWSRVSTTWADCLATGKTYDIDYRFRHRSGSYRWLRNIAMPMRDTDGKILRWYGTSTDIEDAKQLDARKEIVTRELDHRIKNLFSLVSGLVSLSEREEPLLAPLAQRLRLRLNALHQAHGLIGIGGGQEPGSLKSLLHELLDPYRSGNIGQIAVDGEDALIEPNAIAPVTLIFHELATNAVKYGALACPAGRLRVALRKVDGHYAIDWRECFPYPRPDARCPNAKSAGGFGSSLLETIVRRQLHGELSRSLSERELLIAIALPSSLFAGPPGDQR